jgi:putative oxidoreductase
VIEVGSALALLRPAGAPFGAAALIITMIGAVGTHLFVVGGSPALPAALLLGSAVVAWARRDQARL